MRRIKILIEYDGGDFSGWQQQKGVMSVQETIQDIIKQITGETTILYGAGRTDAGVHALGQVAHFELKKDISCYQLQQGLNHFLRSREISILKLQEALPTFHARFSATSRSYVYCIANRDAPPVFERAWHIKNPLDFDLLQECAKMFIGYHNLHAFRDSSCQAKVPWRNISKAFFVAGYPLKFYIEAPSFLHHQVRIIIGSIIEVALSRRSPENLKSLLSGDYSRKDAGITAPADGLFLHSIVYPTEHQF